MKGLRWYFMLRFLLLILCFTFTVHDAFCPPAEEDRVELSQEAIYERIRELVTIYPNDNEALTRDIANLVDRLTEQYVRNYLNLRRAQYEEAQITNSNYFRVLIETMDEHGIWDRLDISRCVEMALSMRRVTDRPSNGLLFDSRIWEVYLTRDSGLRKFMMAMIDTIIERGSFHDGVEILRKLYLMYYSGQIVQNENLRSKFQEGIEILETRFGIKQLANYVNQLVEYMQLDFFAVLGDSSLVRHRLRQELAEQEETSGSGQRWRRELAEFNRRYPNGPVSTQGGIGRYIWHRTSSMGRMILRFLDGCLQRRGY